MAAEKFPALDSAVLDTTPDGVDRWMPESRDIVSYLQQAYG